MLTHGTGVAGEDAAEAACWHNALGDRAASIPAAALTGLTGSLFAGTGGLAIATAAMAVHKQIVPATANFQSPAADCRLNLSAQARPAKIDYVVTGAFSVGGQSGACVLKRYEQ